MIIYQHLGVADPCIWDLLPVETPFKKSWLRPCCQYIQLTATSWPCAGTSSTYLPFGLQSAPKLFNILADLLACILDQQAVSPVLYYLDDFLIMGRADSTTCHDNFAAIQQTCQNLGIPLGETRRLLTFLGIEMDTIHMEARLPQDKLTRISKQLSTWLGKKKLPRGRYFLWLDPYSTPGRLYNQGALSQHECTTQRLKSKSYSISPISTRTFARTCIGGTPSLTAEIASASYHWLTFKPPLITTFRQTHQVHGDVEPLLNPMVSVSLVNRMVNRKHHAKGVGPNCCKLCHLGPYLGTETN